MYTVLIVDDEMLARIGLKSMIDWEQNGFRLIGEAESGDKALAMIRQTPPDIVIADSKMPGMDGVELLTKCREESIASKFIMLSAYGNYEYVRNTLKNGAVDYLLKLEMEPQRLLAALRKAAEEISKKTDDMKTETDSAQLLHAFRILSLEPWSEKNRNCVEAIQNSAYPSADIYFILCRIVDQKGESISDSQFDKTANPLSGTLESILKDYGNTAIFPLYRTETIGVVIALKDGQEDTLSLFSTITSRISETVKYMFNLSLFLGISTLHRSLVDLNAAYLEAKSAAQKALLLNVPSCLAGMKNGVETEEGAFEQEILMLEKAVNELNSGEMRRVFERIYGHILHEKKLSAQQLTGLCYVLVYILTNIYEKTSTNESIASQRRNNAFLQLQKLTGYEEHIAFIKHLENEFISILGKSESNRCIAKAKQYIQKHLCEALSLDVVADHVGLSAGYFSKHFRKQAGLRFTEYVNQQKINRARGMLLSGDYMVSDVALMLGFENISYFSKLFHKITGVTPQNYKQSGGMEQNELVQSSSK